MSHHMTKAQHERLAAELAELEGPKRTEIVEAIAVARGHGDLSENFEYHAAKNEQGMLERRIRILRDRLDHATLVDETNGTTATVGSRIVVEDDDGERLEIEISSIGGAGTVSPSSPLGAAVLGKHVGDTAEVKAPGGAWTAKILEIRSSS
jgi:transcription elongation factor GreA